MYKLRIPMNLRIWILVGKFTLGKMEGAQKGKNVKLALWR